MLDKTETPDFDIPDMSHIEETRVEALLRGAVDLHVHSGPAVMPRQLDHIEALEEAAAAGMRALLLKDHYYPTAALAEMLNARRLVEGTEVLGSVVLNNAVGGINPYAVQPALLAGARIVWMPTISAANHIREGHNKTLLPTKFKMMKQRMLSPVDDMGQVTDATRQVLDLVAEHDAVLSCGHLHISEVWPLFEEARSRGVTRLLVNHPTFTVDCEPGDMRALADAGVFLEHSSCMMIQCRMQKMGGAALKALIEAGTVEQTFFGSDLGQVNAPRPVEGMRMTIRLLLGLGYDDDQVRKMVADNASRLAGLGRNSASRPV